MSGSSPPLNPMSQEFLDYIKKVNHQTYQNSFLSFDSESRGYYTRLCDKLFRSKVDKNLFKQLAKEIEGEMKKQTIQFKSLESSISQRESKISKLKTGDERLAAFVALRGWMTHKINLYLQELRRWYGINLRKIRHLEQASSKLQYISQHAVIGMAC